MIYFSLQSIVGFLSILVAESIWEKPSAFGIPLGTLLLFWLAMQSLQKGNANSEQSKAELRKIRRQAEREQRKRERQSSMPKCPFCGGRLEGEYPKCMHCASDLAWRSGKPLKPEDAGHFIPPSPNPKSDPSAWRVCARCGKNRFVSMFRDFDSSGRPSGPTHAVCSTCRNREG